jgi:hypothetical protein
VAARHLHPCRSPRRHGASDGQLLGRRRHLSGELRPRTGAGAVR